MRSLYLIRLIVLLYLLLIFSEVGHVVDGSSNAGFVILTHGAEFTVTIYYYAPTYIPVDQPVVIKGKLEASVYTFSEPQLFIAVKIACGNVKHIVKTFTLGLRSGAREFAVEVVIPSKLLETLTCHPASLYLAIYRFVSGGYVYGREEDEHGLMTPIKVYLVRHDPILVVDSKDDVIYLNQGESRRVEFTLKSLNAGAFVKRIDIAPPGFISIISSPPVPLYIEPGQSLPIALTVKGASPGAGVIAIRIVYGASLEERYLDLYLPIVVSTKDVLNLIFEYRNATETYINLLKEIAQTYGSIDDIKNASHITYWLRDRIVSQTALLEEKINNLTRDMDTSLARLEQHLTERIGRVESELASCQARLSEHEKSITRVEVGLDDLKNDISFLRTVLLPLSAISILIVVLLLALTLRKG